MSNSIITTAGLALIARAVAENRTIAIDRMIFGDIPNLNVDLKPDPGQGLPEIANIMLNAEIEKTGRIDANTIVYSKVLGSEDGTFYINWIGLYSSTDKTLIAASHVPRHKKYKTDGFQVGNTLYKNFSVQFANAAALTAVTVSPDTWQYDYDSRYALKRHTHPEIVVGDGLYFVTMGEAEIETGGTAGNGLSWEIIQ